LPSFGSLVEWLVVSSGPHQYGSVAILSPNHKKTIYKRGPKSEDVNNIEMYLSLSVGIMDRFHILGRQKQMEWI
jgi:hypothetical protein